MCEYNYVESEDSKKYRETRGRLEDAIKSLEWELKAVSQAYIENYLEKDMNTKLEIAQKERAATFLDLVSRIKICFDEEDTFIIEYYGRNNFYTLLKYGNHLVTNFKKGDNEIFKIFYMISYLPELIIDTFRGIPLSGAIEKDIREKCNNLLEAFVDFSKI